MRGRRSAVSESRYDQLRDDCIRFHRANPEVWRLFEKFTFDRIRRGFSHYSVNGVFERIRWETAEADVQGNEFKLNNNYRPFYARAFMSKYPEYDGFFRTRFQKSKEDLATSLPELGPEDYPTEEQVRQEADLFGHQQQDYADSSAGAWLFSEGLAIVTANGRTEQNARPQLARMAKDFEPDRVIKALQEAKGKQDPLNYARKILGGNNRQKGNGMEEFLNG